MKALQRPGRVATVIGAVAAVSAGTMIAMFGTASAAEPAKCVDNVNVREQPRIDARVVALCEAGTTVEAGEIRNGFVRLTDLGGWASQEFISINGQKPVKPTAGSGTTSDTEGTGSGTRSGRSGGTTSDDPEGTGSGTPSGRSGGTTADEGVDETADPRATDRSESRTNGRSDANGDGSSAKPAPAPAPAPKPAGPLPGGLLPGT